MNSIVATELNPEQQAAVDSNAPKRLVICGPGGGKTATLIAAVEHTAKLHGAAGCVVITYTNAAALELQTRLAARGVTGLGHCGTLHSFLFRMLCECSATALSVIDNEQREALLTSIMEDMGVTAPMKLVLEAADREPNTNTKPDKVQLVALEYRMRLRESGLIDFQEILWRGNEAIQLLANDGRWPFHSLFGDEVQDAAGADWCFYGTAPFKRKFLVGDPDQAIYSFRGALPQLLVRMADTFGNPKTHSPDYEVHWLQDNYRCRENICLVAQRLIENNTRGLPKSTYGVHEGGTVHVQGCANPAAELSFVLEDVQGFLDLTERHQVAVLARTNRLAHEFATHLSANGIPVATVEPAPRPSDWREAKLLLTVLANPWSDTAVLQLIRASEGDRDAKLLREAAAMKMCGVNELLGFRYGKGDATIDADLSKHGLTMESRQRVHDGARELGRLGNWSLNDLIVYLGEQDAMDRTVGTGVTCCTVHQSKGREFDCVFVVGCEDGTFPSSKDTATLETLEESRRLMFVAMTRARHRLVLTWCAERPQFRGVNIPPGPMEKREPSRFLKESGLL